MSTPPGSPPRNRTYKIPSTSRKTKNNMKVNSIINKLKNNNNLNLSPLLNQFKTKLQNGSITEENRKGASPYNKIYISNESNNGVVKKVYKVGLKNLLTNEYLCYSLLKKKYPDDVNIHYSKMYGCENILDSKFVLLVIQCKENIKPISAKNLRINGNKNKENLVLFNTHPKITNIHEYLKKAGIIHIDDHGNFFYYNDNLNNFYIIDFEEVIFIRNKNEENQITINELHGNIKNKSKNLYSNINYFKNNNPSPSKKLKSSLFENFEN